MAADSRTISRTTHRTMSRLLWKWRWKFTTKASSVWSSELMKSTLTVYYALTLVTMGLGHPLTSPSQTECDWIGRGSISSRSTSAQSVQTVHLGCSRGRLHWEDPKGGLQVSLNPHLLPPYQLCLEDTRPSSAHRILLQEKPGKLLHILSTERKNSECYRIESQGALLFVETHGPLLGQTAHQKVKGSSGPISIAYELEPLRGDGDPCRPCSEAEILRAYCSADAVARGSILEVSPGKLYDSIYIQSDLVLHQNQPVFRPLSKTKPLENFLNQSPDRFDMDKPQKLFQMKRGQLYGGILSHPARCSASIGDGDFLWLIKFRFGLAMPHCVTYWDKWQDIARNGVGECPLSTGQEFEL